MLYSIISHYAMKSEFNLEGVKQTNMPVTKKPRAPASRPAQTAIPPEDQLAHIGTLLGFFGDFNKIFPPAKDAGDASLRGLNLMGMLVECLPDDETPPWLRKHPYYRMCKRGYFQVSD